MGVKMSEVISMLSKSEILYTGFSTLYKNSQGKKAFVGHSENLELV